MNLQEALTQPSYPQDVVRNVETYRNRQGRDYVFMASALVKTAFEVADKTDEDTYTVYAGLHGDPSPTRGAMKLASIAMQCLGRVVRRQQALYKQALGMGELWGATEALKGTGGAILDSAHLAAMVGAGMGAAVGGGAWALNRGITGQDQKLREMELQRDTYNGLATEVQNELKRRKMKPTPENQAAAVDYLT